MQEGRQRRRAAAALGRPAGRPPRPRLRVDVLERGELGAGAARRARRRPRARGRKAVGPALRAAAGRRARHRNRLACQQRRSVKPWRPAPMWPPPPEAASRHRCRLQPARSGTPWSRKNGARAGVQRSAATRGRVVAASHHALFAGAAFGTDPTPTILDTASAARDRPTASCLQATCWGRVPVAGLSSECSRPSKSVQHSGIAGAHDGVLAGAHDGVLAGAHD